MLQRRVGGSQPVLYCQRLDTFNTDRTGGAKRNTLPLSAVKFLFNSKLLLCSTSKSQPFVDHVLACVTHLLEHSVSPYLRAWEQTQRDSEDEGGMAGLTDSDSYLSGWEEEQGTIRTALCRGLSLRPPKLLSFWDGGEANGDHCQKQFSHSNDQ